MRALTAVRTSSAVVCVGLGAALLLWLAVLAVAALAVYVVALATLVLVPVMLVGAGLKLWPGGALRVTDPEGTTVTLLEAIAGGIKARSRRMAWRES